MKLSLVRCSGSLLPPYIELAVCNSQWSAVVLLESPRTGLPTQDSAPATRPSERWQPSAAAKVGSVGHSDREHKLSVEVHRCGAVRW